jgi:DeoR family transcriptional regulator, catabolite repression regulator
MSTQNNNQMLVSDVMMPLDRMVVIGEIIIMKEALEKMGRSHLGIACVVDTNNKLLGILTDGDIRRKLLKVQKPFSALLVDDALEHAIRSPTTIKPDIALKDAIVLMGEKKIWDLPVVNSQGIVVGLLHLHPAIQALLGI